MQTSQLLQLEVKSMFLSDRVQREGLAKDHDRTTCRPNVIPTEASCLPTPLNLKRWKIKVAAQCALCGSHSPTTSRFLNGCPTALDQGRYVHGDMTLY